jgi:hypothetical protein
MRDCHVRRLTERERSRREHEQRGGAAVVRHAGDAGGLDAAVRPHAAHEREPLADLVLRHLEHPALLIEAARGDLGGMRVDGDGRKTLGRRYVAQMAAEAALIDGEVVVEREQHGRDDTVRDVVRMSRHLVSPRDGVGRGTATPVRDGRGVTSLYQSFNVNFQSPA